MGVIRFAALAGSSLATIVVAQPALAQSSNPSAVGASSDAGQASGTGQDIVVVGTRLGSGDASDVKRRALQSVSVLTAADIEKDPDTTLADVIRRVPGVQVAAAGGGGIITIRGLSQTEDRINGRNLASTVGRGFDIAGLPSDLVSGIDVYKTPSASQIEGGIGGVVDLHTRRPFDFDKAAAAFTAKGGYADIQKSWQPYLSGYVSDRWETGIGEIGLLAGGAYQRQAIGQYLSRVDTNVLIGSSPTQLDAPLDAIKRYFHGTKELNTVYGSAQWKPANTLTITGDILYNKGVLDVVTNSLSAQLAGITPTSVATYGGTNSVSSANYANVPLQSSTSHGYGSFDTTQAGLNAQYVKDRLTVSAEGSYTRTTFRYVAPQVTLQATAPSLALNLADTVPNFTVAGLDPTAGNSFAYNQFSDFQEYDQSSEWAYRADAIYAFDGILKALKVGVRYDKRDVGSSNGFGAASAPATIGQPVAPYADLSRSDLGVAQPQWYQPSDSQVLDNANYFRSAFGVATGPEAFNPANTYSQVEKVYNGYIEGTFGFALGGINVDGNAGIRYAKTKLDVLGQQSLPGGGLGPISASQNYGNWLPSINIRAELARQLYLRLSYSQQVSRPAFYQTSPALTLDFVNKTGGAGNPLLKPLTADQYDTSLEWYFAKDGSLYAAAFYKDVTGFIRNETRTEMIDGSSYQINRPFNLSSGWIGGAEIGYQQKFSFLPGALSGLGIQASYTYVDSSRPTNSAGYKVPLEYLSHHNYVITGSYDYSGITASVAWNWRSRLVESSSADALGRPLYRNAYGQLDATLAYAITPRVSVFANIVNALARRTTEYYLSRNYFSQTYVEDRRIFGGVQIKLGAAR